MFSHSPGSSLELGDFLCFSAGLTIKKKHITYSGTNAGAKISEKEPTEQPTRTTSVTLENQITWDNYKKIWHLGNNLFLKNEVSQDLCTALCVVTVIYWCFKVHGKLQSIHKSCSHKSTTCHLKASVTHTPLLWSVRIPHIHFKLVVGLKPFTQSPVHCDGADLSRKLTHMMKSLSHMQFLQMFRYERN